MSNLAGVDDPGAMRLRRFGDAGRDNNATSVGTVPTAMLSSPRAARRPGSQIALAKMSAGFRSRLELRPRHLVLPKSFL